MLTSEEGSAALEPLELMLWELGAAVREPWRECGGLVGLLFLGPFFSFDTEELGGVLDSCETRGEISFDLSTTPPPGGLDIFNGA